jgi:nitrogenase molybdenum-iron protein NifN
MTHHSPKPVKPASVKKVRKALSVSPLKTSAPLGAAMAFMGIEGAMPLFHGSQGCTAFALVMLVRHFREAIPLQTTAMNEVSTILGGMDNVEQALVNVVKRSKPKFIGLATTALTETRGEDLVGDLKLIRARNRELDDVVIVPVQTPDFIGGLEMGWGKAVSAIIRALVPEGRSETKAETVNILAGSHLSPGDIEEIKDMVEAFGLAATVLPDLSDSLDGHVPEKWIPHTLGGTRLDAIRAMGAAKATFAIGEHMRISGEVLEGRTGVPTVQLDRLTGLEAVDTFVKALSEVSGRPVPNRLRRQRNQLVDGLMDSHFAFGGARIALAGEPDMVWAHGTLAEGMGAILQAVTVPTEAPHLAGLKTATIEVGDLEDLADRSEGCDLMIANANGRLPARRAGIPHFRAGFPIVDRVGSNHRVVVGYRGTRDLSFALANALMDAHEAHAAHGDGAHEDTTPIPLNTEQEG